MGARKNRPDKFRGDVSTGAKFVATRLTCMLKEAERQAPRDSHYVGWPDMNEARALARNGWLEESGVALGCFYVTDKFRAATREDG